jgi:anti-sigma factor RsiW
MNDEHFDEDLELYALGALDRDEAQAVEAHAAVCAECSRRLGEAERAVASLDELTVPIFEPPAELGERIASAARTVVPLRPRRPLSVARWGTLAACFLVAAAGITGTREVARDRATIASDDRAFSAIAASHFAHTTFTKTVPGAPTAKVLWGKNPQWLYVIVDSRACACNVVARTAAGERDLGAPEPRDATATLFVDNLPGVTSVELRSGTRVIATAQHP